MTKFSRTNVTNGAKYKTEAWKRYQAIKTRKKEEQEEATDGACNLQCVYSAPNQAKLIVLQLLIVKRSPEKLLYDRSSMETDTPIVDENCWKSKVAWS